MIDSYIEKEWRGGAVYYEDRLNYERWYCGHYHCSKKIDRITIMFEDFEEFLK